jgi:hypothetical protein
MNGRSPYPIVKVQRRVRFPRPELPAPHKPQLNHGGDEEILTGAVDGMKASAAEERFATALNRAGHSFEFRYTLGAPRRGLPGWKELDFLVTANGQVYPVEMDSPFSHRAKKRADVLHDAIVLKDLEKLGVQVYPSVIHVNGELDCADEKTSKNKVKQLFGDRSTVATYQELGAEKKPDPLTSAPVTVKEEPEQMSKFRQKIREQKRSMAGVRKRK